MTASTEQERAEFEAVASDYGACPKAIERDAKGNYLLMHTATGWMWWQAARRAQVVHVNLSQADSEKMIELVQSGNYQVVQDDAALQPPEANPVELHQIKTAAPVQMPEPLARIEGGSLKWHIPDSRYSLPVRYLQGTHNLYTEHQVLQLLAAHGVK